MAKNGRNGVRTFLVVIIMIGAPIASVAGSVTPNDTLWNDMWNVRRVDADDAWDLDNNNKYSNMGSNSVVIAVIDTGLDWDTNPNNRHEDFAVDMVWTNPREVTDDGNNDGYPGVGDFDDDGDGLIDEDSDGDSRYLADGVTVNPEWDDDMDNDDDENGYEDDFYGWNFYDDDNDISDEGEECAWWSVDHGTMVTSVISAKVNNGKGISGISPKIKIMVIKMSGDSGVLTSAQMEACFVEGINYAINNGADVISMSWRWPDGDQWPDGGVFDTEFQQAYNNGIFLCAASGNSADTSDRIEYPAHSEFVMAVGATDSQDPENRASYSSYTDTTQYPNAELYEHVEIVAPSGDDGSGDKEVKVCDNIQDPDKYIDVSGTSFACPAVAATAAVMMSYQPSLTPDRVRELLRNTADDSENFANGDGWDMYTGFGRLNHERALRTIVDEKQPFNHFYDLQSGQYFFGGAMPGTEPAIDIDCNGYLHVAFVREFDHSGIYKTEICYLQLNPNGNVEVQWTRIEQGTASFNIDSLDPAIRIDHDDNVNIIWKDVAQNDIWFMKMNVDSGVIQVLHASCVLSGQQMQQQGAIWGGNSPPYHLSLLSDIQQNVNYYITFSKADSNSNGNSAIFVAKLQFNPAPSLSKLTSFGGQLVDLTSPAADIYNVDGAPGNKERLVLVWEVFDSLNTRYGLWIVIIRTTNAMISLSHTRYPVLENLKYIDPDVDVDYDTGQISIVFRRTPVNPETNGDLMYMSIYYDENNPNPVPPFYDWMTYLDGLMEISQDLLTAGSNYYNPKLTLNRHNEVRIVFDHSDAVWSLSINRDGRFLNLEYLSSRDTLQNYAYPQIVSTDIHYNHNLGAFGRKLPFDNDANYYIVYYRLQTANSPMIFETTKPRVVNVNYELDSDIDTDSEPDIAIDDYDGRHIVWAAEDDAGNYQVYYEYYKPGDIVGYDNPVSGTQFVTSGTDNHRNPRVDVSTMRLNNGDPRVLVNIIYTKYTSAQHKGDLHWAQYGINPSTHTIVDGTNLGEVVGSSTYNNYFYNVRIRSYCDYTLAALSSPNEFLYITWYDASDNIYLIVVNWENDNSKFKKVKVVTYNGKRPELDVDSLGNVYFVYEANGQVKLYKMKFVNNDFSPGFFAQQVAHPPNQPTIIMSMPNIALDRDFHRVDMIDFDHNQYKNYKNCNYRKVHIVYDGKTVYGDHDEHHLYYVTYDTEGNPLTDARDCFPPDYDKNWEAYAYYFTDPVKADIETTFENEVLIVFSSKVETSLVDSMFGYKWHVIDQKSHLWFSMITNNGEVYTNPIIMNFNSDYDCVYGKVGFKSNGDFDVVFSQEDSTDTNIMSARGWL